MERVTGYRRELSMGGSAELIAPPTVYARRLLPPYAPKRTGSRRTMGTLQNGPCAYPLSSPGVTRQTTLRVL